MTDHTTPTSDDPREAFERGRLAFGAALVAAAEAREEVGASSVRSRRRRRGLAAVGGLVLAGGTVALAIGVPAPAGLGSGDDDQPGRPPVIGASPALAAVTAMRDSLRDGVLFRDVTSVGHFAGPNGGRSRTQDWTDLTTRDVHVKFVGRQPSMEYWNRGAHERIELQPTEFLAPDGRRVVTVARDTSVGNASATQSPAEEIERLLAQVEAGRITLRAGGRQGERVLESVSRCFSWNQDAALECGEARGNPKNKGAHWPDTPPADARAVRLYERWWISAGDEPRMLRYDNGTMPPTGNRRRVLVNSVWNDWRVLPRNDATLALVRPPRFDPKTYAVVRGNNSVVSQGIKTGKIVCKSDRPDFCDIR